MQLNKISQKEDTKSRSVSIIVVVRENRLKAYLLYRGASGSDLKKEHCLYLNSDYRVGPYD